jgi:hypothetical protein
MATLTKKDLLEAIEDMLMDAEFEFTANRYQDDEHEVSIDNIYTSTMLNKIYVDLIC